MDISVKGSHHSQDRVIMDYLPRIEIFSSNRWIKEFSYITTEVDLIKDKIRLVNCIGGFYRAGPDEVRPTRFLCFLAKLVELHLDNEIFLKFLMNTEFKYLRVMGALYFRLVAHCKVCLMKYFEPLLSDGSTICILKENQNMQTILMEDLVLKLIDLETFCHILLPKMQVNHVTAKLSPKPPKSSGTVLNSSLTQNEEEHRNSLQTQRSPSLDRLRPSSSSPPHQDPSTLKRRRTHPSRPIHKQLTDNQDYDHCLSDQKPYLYTNAASSDSERHHQPQSEHSRLVNREHLVFGVKTAPSRGIEWGREGTGVNRIRDLRDLLLDKRRSRNVPERPATRDWYCIENRPDHHEGSNHREFHLNGGRLPAENFRQDRDSRFKTDRERYDTKDRGLSGFQNDAPFLINQMGRAVTTPQRGIEPHCEEFRGSPKGAARDYLHDLLNPSLLERERQEKSDEDNMNSGSDPFRERVLLKDREEFAGNQYSQLQYGSSHVLLNPERLSSWDQQPDENRRDHCADRETGSHHLARQDRDNTCDLAPEESIREHSEDRDSGSDHPNHVRYWDLDVDENQPDWWGYGRNCSPLNDQRYVSNYQGLPEHQERDDHHQDGGNLSQPTHDGYDTRDRPYFAGYLKSSVFMVDTTKKPSGIEQDRDSISISQHDDNLRDHAQDGNDGSNGSCSDRDLNESLCDQPIDYCIHSRFQVVNRSGVYSGYSNSFESKDSSGTPLTGANLL